MRYKNSILVAFQLPLAVLFKASPRGTLHYRSIWLVAVEGGTPIFSMIKLIELNVVKYVLIEPNSVDKKSFSSNL